MKEELPGYSVSMSVYAGEKPENLAASLESMLTQTLPCTELILVCDGELTPALDEVTAEYSRRFEGRMRVLRSSRNVGVGACANAALRAARTDIIVKMDSDDISLPERCEKQVRLLAERPGLDMCGAFLEEFDDVTNEKTAVKSTPVYSADVKAYARRRNPFNNPTFAYRRSAALAAGGYSQKGRCEDYDFVVKMLMNGSEGENIPEVLLRYRVTKGNLQRRRNLANTKGFIAVRYKNYRRGFSSLADFLIPCAAQIMLFFMPPGLTGLFYKKLLRR